MAKADTMDMSQLQDALTDPQINELTEKLSQDPEFKKLQDQLQRSQAAGNKDDEDRYVQAMEKLFQNENFMNMASQIGQQIMAQNPEIQNYSKIMSDPKMKGEVEKRMQQLRRDPALKKVFKDLDKEGPMAMMKYQDDPQVSEKFNNAFKDLTPPQGAGGIPEEDEDEDDLKDYPLLAKAADGDLAGVKEILSKKEEDVNQSDDENRTALHFASGYGHMEVVEYLIKHKAKVDVTDETKSTPLHYAAGYGQLEIVKYLIHKKANKKAQTEDGKTPLEVAELNHQKDVVDYLK